MSDTVIRGYKFRIYPTEEQRKTIDRYIEIFREVYNWGLNKEEEYRQSQKEGKSKYGFYRYYDLRKMYKKERRENPDSIWNEMPSVSGGLALKNVETAYLKFFKKLTRYPKPKGKTTDKSYYSFNTRYERFNIHGDSIKIEGIKTRIALKFNCGIYSDKVINPTISRDKLNRYFVSFNLKQKVEPLNIPISEGIGIDLGCRQTIVLSTGEIFNQPNENLEKLDRKRRREQKRVTRDINYRKALAAYLGVNEEDIPKSKRALRREFNLNKTYKKIHNIKNTFYHTVSKHVVDRNPAFICMETFKVREIQRERPFMNDELVKVSFYTITQMFKYKCENVSIPFYQAPRDFASTKICSNCGNKKEMYNYRKYKCPVCGMIEDRDINAAINLRNYGYKLAI